MTARLIHAEPLDTERLTLLPLCAGHAVEMAAVLSDPALHTFIGGAPETLDELRARYARLTAGSPDPAVSWCNWVIEVRAEECLAGTVQATIRPAPGGATAGSDVGRDDRPGGSGLLAEIAWVVGMPWQGRGFATEAARGLVRGLEEQGVRTFVAHVHPENRASAAVAAAAGLVPTEEWHGGEMCWRRHTGPGAARTPWAT
ncbi:GNAT family N-acetyltransferase [Streptomyces sp. NPDC088725]|uniref:GNAT family N-acetyltransferase n=1 Tax=Streptomyces sp. NPDC088725 TaxID=3365873 RepID=UPI00381010D4